jgi:hypothetical protein
MKSFFKILGEKKPDEPSKTTLELLEQELADQILDDEAARSITGGAKSVFTLPRPALKTTWHAGFGDDLKL